MCITRVFAIVSLCHFTHLHLFCMVATQEEYKDKLGPFLDQKRVADMKRSVQALAVTFHMSKTLIFSLEIEQHLYLIPIDMSQFVSG